MRPLWPKSASTADWEGCLSSVADETFGQSLIEAFEKAATEERVKSYRLTGISAIFTTESEYEQWLQDNQEIPMVKRMLDEYQPLGVTELVRELNVLDKILMLNVFGTILFVAVSAVLC